MLMLVLPLKVQQRKFANITISSNTLMTHYSVLVPIHFATLPVLKPDLPVLQPHCKPCCCMMGSPFLNH